MGEGLQSELDETFYTDFARLPELTPRELVTELLDTVINLSRLSERIGFLRAEELRDQTTLAKQERLGYEGVRAVYEEKKWVILRLLDLTRPVHA